MNKISDSRPPDKWILPKQVNQDGYVQQVFSDISEAVLDQVFTDGLMKDIPIVGTVVNFYKSIKSIRQQLTVKKLALFVGGIYEFTETEKQKMKHLFEGDEKKQREFAQNILLALDRQDDIEKPLFLIRFFKALVNEEIDLLTFSRLKQALEKFNLELLSSLRIFYGEELKLSPINPAFSEEISHELSLSGLATVSLASSGTIGGSASYVRNSIGELFIQIGFKNIPNSGIKPSSLDAHQ